MSDIYGLESSLQGYDVETAADFHKLFSSNWPMLKIHMQGSFSLADATLDQDIVTHSLGYFPLFWVFLTNDDGFDYSTGQSRFESRGTPMVSTTKLRWMGATTGEPAGSVSGYYYIFRFDLTTNYTATTIFSAATSQGVLEEFGIDIAKPNENVESSDLRDFVIHHKTRSPQVHKSGTVNAVSTTITHNLTYIPLFFVFYKQTIAGTDYYISVTNSQSTFSSATTTTLTFGTVGVVDWAYLILKDPFEIN